MVWKEWEPLLPNMSLDLSLENLMKYKYFSLHSFFSVLTVFFCSG